MSRDLSAIISRFSEIATQILDTEGLPHHGLHQYCGSTGTPENAARYVRHQADLLALAGRSASNAVIIDAGCGFGFALIVQALLGAQAVHGVEFSADMAATVEAYLPLLPPDVGSRLTITPTTVTAMPFEDESADIVLSIEAISHYIDVEGFIDEAWRVLRPNGVMVISDQNNAANPIVKRRMYKYWEALETGKYATRRAKTLADHFPTLSDADQAELARAMAGFTEEEVVAAGDAYVREGVRPTSVYRRGEVAIQPRGMAMERLFVPSELAREISRRGFEAKAYSYWGGANGNPALRAANRVLSAMSAVTMPAAFSFRVVARKTSRAK